MQYSCNCVFSLDFHVYIDFLVFFLGGGALGTLKSKNYGVAFFQGYQGHFMPPPLKTIVGGIVDLLGFVRLPSVLPIQPLTPLVGRGCRQGPPGPDPGGGGKGPP